MLELSKVLLIFVGTIVVFRVIRGLWMKAQVKSAVRRDLLPPQATVLALTEEHFFQSCGSIRNAIRTSLCDRNFSVTYRKPGGTDHKLDIIAVFHPVIGILREVVLSSERWELVIGPQGEA
ncbi:hypothetical protein [Luteolibacter soli]|uniref:Uncharacterized protein n=1 Tax=Luteolibacter soli TaxID=3135280 RepID=A0ABU9AZL2_9BACT